MVALHNAVPTIERRGYTDIETAQMLGVSVATLRRWRMTQGDGPKFRKLGGSVRYFREDIEAYIASSPSGGGTAQTEAA